MKKIRDIKKADIKIDMTPMVDVIMLLLTFFMLTATFKIVESTAVEVTLPKSSDADTSKVPDTKLMTITLTKAGDIFLDIDNPVLRKELFGDEYGIGVYHPDSTTQSEFKTSGKVGGMDFKRPVMFLPTKAEFEKKLTDIKVKGPRDEKGNSALKVVIKGDQDADFGAMEDLMASLKETRNSMFHMLTQLKREKN
ncbi:MAG TPA: biopolymer transporter ExbD [Ignavibacteria bacterium]